MLKEMMNRINFVDLKGSEKQIKWAEDIRNHIAGGFERRENGSCAIIDELQELIEEGYLSEEKAEARLKFAEYASQIEDATWWINHRGEVAIDIVDDEVYGTNLCTLYRRNKRSKSYADWLETH